MSHKTCSTCMLVKHESLFRSNRNQCKACISIRQKAYNKANAEHLSLKSKEWTLANIDNVRAREKRYRENNKSKEKARKINYEAENSKAISIRKANYYRENKEKILKRCSDWAKNNKGKQRAKTARGRVAKLKRSMNISDFDRKLIKLIYDNCPKGHEVDHIIPLQGKIVSGLHTPRNLQYLTVEDNRRKGNNYEA